MIQKKVTQFKLENDPITYSLHFDFNDLVAAEADSGFNLLRCMENLNTMSAGQLRGLLYALLKGGGHAEVELHEAGTLLHRPDRTTVIEAIHRALEIKTPDEVLLEALARIAAEDPGVLVEMLRKAGVSFQVETPESENIPA